MESQGNGLVLTAGGARGAYQAGVLKGIAQILKDQVTQLPFGVVAGSSAGAINSSYLACNFKDFDAASKSLCELWSELHFSDIFKTDASSIGFLGYQWAKGLTFAGMGTHSAPNHLLDTKPLWDLINKKIPLSRLPDFESQGGILAVNATDYNSGAAITFYSESSEFEEWYRTMRFSVRAKITATHIMASSAIPILFPPIKVGKSFYGDGALRMKSPLSAAIHLGAKKILAIGVKKNKSRKELLASMDHQMDDLKLSDIAGIILNSVFLDSLDVDVERLERINKTLGDSQSKPIKILSKLQNTESQTTSLRQIETLVIQPSEDLGDLARPILKSFPRTVRYLLKGLGMEDASGGELISYLSFHPSYTGELIQLGYEDTIKRADQVLDFWAK